jgi:hypothetical protein
MSFSTSAPNTRASEGVQDNIYELTIYQEYAGRLLDREDLDDLLAQVRAAAEQQ